MEEIHISGRIPLHIVFLHHLARTGKATWYSDSRRTVRININEAMESKWVELQDAVSVNLLYSSQESKFHVM